MEKFKNKKLFSLTPSALKKGTVVALCMIMSGLFFAVGCNKKDDEKKPIVDPPEEPVYPIKISFTEYLLTENCQWENLAYDNSVIVINNDEELGKYVSCTGDGYPKIDFSEKSLLLASGETAYCISDITTKILQQLSANIYEFELEITLNDTVLAKPWQMAIIVPEKLNNESTVDLKIKTIEETTCKFENPLIDLPWLKELVDKVENDGYAHARIYQCTYKYGIGFQVSLHYGMPDSMSDFRNCEGVVLCYMGGFSGENQCLEYDIDYENKKFIWGTEND